MKKLLIAAWIVSGTCVGQDDIATKSVAFVNLFKTGDFERATAMFADDLQTQIPDGALSGLWEQISIQGGKLKKATFNCSEVQDSVTIAYVTSQFKNQTFDFKIAFNNKMMVMAMMPVPPHVCGEEEVVREWIAPAYDDPTKYTTSDFEVWNGDYKLPGTLTMPVENKKNTVVVFVHGSGQNDRDESAFGNKTFKDLAIGLANDGYATVRYDKRGFANQIKNPETFTVYEEVLDDVDAVVDWISKNERLKAKKIIVLGHSLGAMLAPYTAENNEKVAGIIMMAGPANRLEDLIAYQIELLANLDGKLTKEEKAQIAEINRRAAFVKNDLAETASPSDIPMNATASYWISLNQIDQLSLAKHCEKPMLILNGERDYQVPMSEFEVWKQNLGEKENVTFVSFAKLNHFFFEGEGPASPDEYTIPAHVPEYVFAELIAWLDKL